MSDIDRLINWIEEGLEQPGLSQKGLARHLGLSHSQVSRLLSRKRKLRIDEIHKISVYLGTQPPVLPSGESTYSLTPMRSIRQAPVRYWLGLGIWREEGWVSQDVASIPTIPHDRLNDLDQYACRLDGSEYGSDCGSYCICVPYSDLRSGPVDNDLVHAVMTSPDHKLQQHVLARVHLKGGVATIVPEGMGNGSATLDGVEIRIIGLVVARHYPIAF